MKFSKTTLFCQKLAKQGGELALKRFNKRNFTVKTKADTTFQTSVDIEVEELIKSQILMQFPDHDIHGEEKGKINNQTDYCWHIDPIDGTTSFVLGMPLFSTIIALRKGQDLICCSIYDPTMKRLITAERNAGVTLNQQEVKSLNQETHLSEIVLLIDRSAKKQNQLTFGKFLTKNAYKFKSVKSIQGVGVNMTIMASGQPVLYIGMGEALHDFLGPILITKELGGLALNFKLEPWDINNPGWLILTSKELKSTIKKQLDFT